MDCPRHARTRSIETQLTRWDTCPKNACFSGSGFRFTCPHRVIVYLSQPFLEFTPRHRLRWRLIIPPCFTSAFCGFCESVNQITLLLTSFAIAFSVVFDRSIHSKLFYLYLLMLIIHIEFLFFIFNFIYFILPFTSHLYKVFNRLLIKVLPLY